MSVQKSIRRVASAYLRNNGFYPPELIGAEKDGALEYNSDETYMSDTFTEQRYRELSDRQLGGELGDGSPITERRSPQSGRKGERVATYANRMRSRR